MHAPVPHTIARQLFEQDNPPLAEIESRLREVSDENVSVNETTLMTLQQAIERAAAQFFQAPNDIARLEAYDSLVSIIRAAQLPVNLRQPQNMYYEMKRSVRPVVAGDSEKSLEAEQWLALFDALGEKLSVSAEAAA